MLLASLLIAPVAFVRTPKVDDRATYSLAALIDLGGQDDVRFEGTFRERVKAVENGRVTTSVSSLVRVDVMGVVREGRAVESDRVEGLDGSVVEAAKVDGVLLFATLRVDRLRAFYPPEKPVESGVGWWRTEGRRDESKAPPFSSYLVLLGEEKVGTRDAWRVSLDAGEVAEDRPVRVRGMVWIDKGDGSLVKGQWTIDGFTYSATAPPGNARLEMTRTDVAPPPTSALSFPGAGSSSGTAPRNSPSRRSAR